MSPTGSTAHGEEQSEPGRGRDLSIDYLRTTLTLMVLAHHSCLAYTSWAYFDREDVFRSTSPVVDVTRWAFFDYAENFNDVFFMSLMFFVSGLFVYPALRRHGTAGFVRDRMLRLGVPFALAVVVLMPIAYYASWQMTGRSAGFVAFYRQLAARGFMVGPPWFIWVLLLFDVIVALLLVGARGWMGGAERVLRGWRDRPASVFSGVLVLSAGVYLPLLAGYGFSAWTVVFTSPFAFQTARIGLYGLWFAGGVLVGSPGLGEGLLARDGGLARQWPYWLGGCIAAYNMLWFVPRLGWMHRHLSGPQLGALEAMLWVLSCVASCFGFLAWFRGVAWRPHGWMLSLGRAAYGMYLVHYVFVTWMQRVALGRAIPAEIKFVFVFVMTVVLSWLSAEAALRVPKLKTIL